MRKGSKTITYTTVIAAFALLLTGCGDKQFTERKQSISIMEQEDLGTLDNAQASNMTMYNMVNNVEEGLYRMGKDNKPHPGLATKVAQPINHGKTYIIHLKKGLKWNNGDKLDAQDFVYSWQRAVNPKTKAADSYVMENLKNYNAILHGKKSPKALGVKALNSTTLRIDLTVASPYMNSLLAFASFFPVNPKTVKKAGTAYGTTAKNMSYCGPFKLIGWNGNNSSWKLVKNNNYWDKRHVKLSTIKVQVIKTPSTALNLFQSKKLDDAYLSGEQAGQEKNSPSFVKNYSSNSGYLAYNFGNKALRNLDLRKAISMTINRKELTSKVMQDGSKPAKGYIPAGVITNPNTGNDFADDTYDAAAVTPNKPKAKALAKKALKQLGTKSVNLILMSSDDDSEKQQAAFIQGAVQQTLPNVHIKIDSIPAKTALQKQMDHKGWDLSMSSWLGDYPDPYTWLQQLQSTGYDYGNWKNNEYDKLVAATNSTDSADNKARFNDFAKAEKMLMDSQVVTPLYQGADTHLRNTKLKGIVYHPTGIPYEYKTAYLK
jgi:oligopeptide transport system substrate-binding protein